MDNSEFQPEDVQPTRMNKHHRYMDDSAIFSGDIQPVEIDRPQRVIPISRENRTESSGSVLPFPQEADYAILQPTTPTEFIPSVRRWVKVSGMFMVGSFGAAIALCAVLKYKVTVQAPAAIRPIGELRLVQSTIEGSVLKISVRENQTVRQGEPIATVKDLRLENKLQTKRSQLAGDIRKAKYQLSTIDVQIAALNRQGQAERDSRNRSIAGINAELSRANRDYRDKRITTQAEVAEAQANWRTAQKEQQAALAELTGADANLKSIQAAYKSALTRSQRYRHAAAAGAISTSQLEEAQLAAEQQAHAIAAQLATIAKQQQLVDRSREAVIATAAKVRRTQAALDPDRAAATTIVQKIASERANSRVDIARSQQDLQKLLQQRIEIVNQIATSDRDIAQTATELQPVAILAPISGKIQELNLRNNLQVVRPGDRIAQIVPTDMRLDIKAAVASSDIDNVKVGYPVQMRVSACPYTDYGTISGTVSEVSADAKSTEKSTGNNAAQPPQTPTNGIYEVTIAPNTLTLDRHGKSCHIRAGMDGRADIISKEETILQFMLRKARLF
jgi:multidrug efflux pump subunit AcrA (membrane-fusion protein)